MLDRDETVRALEVEIRNYHVLYSKEDCSYNSKTREMLYLLESCLDNIVNEDAYDAGYKDGKDHAWNEAADDGYTDGFDEAKKECVYILEAYCVDQDIIDEVENISE